ncbi:MAG: peptide deformylase [Bacteroidia bacterium]
MLKFNKIAAVLLVSLAMAGTLPAQQPGGFSLAEREFILEGRADEPMRVYLITSIEDSMLLRDQSRPVRVDPNDTVLQHFVSRLYATVTDSASLGVGIAAPQVGLLRQIIWVQRFDKEGFPWEVFLNPASRN